MNQIRHALPSRETLSRYAIPFGVIAIVQIVSAAIFLLNTTSGASAGFDRLPIDDAWVRMVFIRNFAESLEIAFHPGDLSSGATSILWVLVPGLFSLVLNPLGISVMAVAKILGILFALGGAWLVYLILLKLTDSKRVSLVGGIVVALDPTRTFSAVSGMEMTLTSTIALAATWSYFLGKHRLTGALLALMVLARPESWVLVIFVGVLAMARRLWDRTEVQLITLDDARALNRLVTPAAVVTLLWVVWNIITGGSPLPSAYYVTRDELGFMPIGNFKDILQGYYAHLSLFNSIFYPVGGGLVIWGAVKLLKTYNLAITPLALFAVIYTYAVAMNITLNAEEFNFTQRRYLDPVIPFLIILFFVGLLQAWDLIRHWRATRSPADPTEARIFNFSLNALFLFVTITPFVGFGGAIFDLPEEYSYNTKNVHEGLVGGALWLKENTPPDARIGTEVIGAVAFYADRDITDFSGRQLGGGEIRETFALAKAEDLDYAFGYSSVYIDSWPPAIPVYTEIVEDNKILATSEINAWKLDFDVEVEVAAAEVPYLLNFEQRNLVVIDTLDVGNPNAPPEASEAVHEYEDEGLSAPVNRQFRVDDNIVLNENARTFTVAEEFKVASRDGERLLIAKRYDAAVGQRLRVVVDGETAISGEDAGIWDLPKRDFFFGEELFVIPGDLITSSRTELRFEFIPTDRSDAGNSFFFWILVDR